MFEEFVLDGEAREIIRSPRGRDWLGPWPELLNALESEGAVTVSDVRAAASGQPQRRGALLRQDMRNPSQWVEPMAYYNAVAGMAEQLLGDDPKSAKRTTWDFNPEAQFGVSGTDGKTHSLASVLNDGPHSEHEVHRSLYSRALSEATFHLREVHACLTACAALGVAPFMWAPYRKYLEHKLVRKGDARNTDKELRAGREFFEIAFPAYAPTTVRQFARLRSDRRISQLREEMRRVADSGELLDPRYPQRILQEVLRVEKRLATFRRIIGWVATAVGVVPIPGIGTAASVLAEGIGAATERKRRKPWHWFYLISDGRGAT